MSIDPTGATRLLTPSAIANAAFREADDAGPAHSDSAQPAAPDVFAQMEERFSSLIDSFRAQLAALEKKFVAALQDSVAHYRAASETSAVQNAPARSTRSAFGGVIDAAAKRNELDPALLTAVIQRESDFDPRAISRAGAQGLMQLMPGTAKELGVTDPFDPRQNVEGGAAYLRGLIDRYHGRLDLALAAYNAGAGAVDRYGGVPPYPETQDYVRGILGAYRASALAG